MDFDNVNNLRLANCRGVPTSIFFPDVGKGVFEAKLICRHCPLLIPCRVYALDNNIRHGVWGGLSEAERKVIRRSRRTRTARP